MKILVNYVVQDLKNHHHDSEIIDTMSPPYTFCPEPPVKVVMEWAEGKQGELSNGQKLIVLSMFKI